MPNAHVFLALLSLCSCSIASPAIQKRSFSVQQESSGNYQVDGAWALRKAYLKYRMPLPPALLKRQAPSPAALAARPKVTDDVIAVSEANVLEYLSPVEIGGQIMKMDFDTGSSDL